jgi:tetratricopeptide (TPR) repeat protein
MVWSCFGARRRETLEWFKTTAAVTVLIGALGGPASAADDRAACNNLSYKPLEFTVPACTRLIEQADLEPAELRLALRRRADAYHFASTVLPEVEQGRRTRLLEQALADVTRAMTLDAGEYARPDPPIVLGLPEIARGQLLSELGRYEAAVDAYTVALERVWEAGPSARLGRALALAELGRYQGAIDDMTELVRLFPNQTRWVFLRGEINEEAGHTAAAVEDYERVLSLDPDHVGAQRALKRLVGVGRY